MHGALWGGATVYVQELQAGVLSDEPGLGVGVAKGVDLPRALGLDTKCLQQKLGIERQKNKQTDRYTRR